MMQAQFSDKREQNVGTRPAGQARRCEVERLIRNWFTHELDDVLTDVLIQSLLALIKLPTSDPAHPHLVHVNRGMECATYLTRQLLDYAQTPPIQMEPVNLNELCRNCRELWRAWAPERLRLQLDLSAEIAPVWGDRQRLHQVLMNFLVNASETVALAGYAGEARNTITVATRPLRLQQDEVPVFVGNDHLPSGEYVCLAVSDRGPGMDRETLAHLFEPSLDMKRRIRKCGLALCLQIIREHHGGIQVRSQPEQGCSVQFCLPAYPFEEATGGRQQLQERPLALVIDDDPGIRHGVAELLALIDVETRTAANSVEAFSLLEAERERIGLVLLDTPPTDSLETYRRLRRIAPEVKVIIASVDGQQFPDHERIIFLAKPYDAETLLRQVRTALAA